MSATSAFLAVKWAGLAILQRKHADMPVPLITISGFWLEI
jgi:hypothetical protein